MLVGNIKCQTNCSEPMKEILDNKVFNTLAKDSAHLLETILLPAFQVFDVEDNKHVTKGEFRRVLEVNCCKVTTHELNQLISSFCKVERNQTINYALFLQNIQEFILKLNGHVIRSDDACVKDEDEAQKISLKNKTCNLTHREATFSKVNKSIDKTMNTCELEKSLKESIETQYFKVLKGFQLFDYNKDGKIQKHELKKILETYCFTMSDIQFDKLWNNFDFSKIGIISYTDFLYKLGVKAKETQSTDRMKKQGLDNNSRKDLAVLPRNIDTLEVQFRDLMKRKANLLYRAFLVIDSMKTGYIKLSSFKKILDDIIISLSEIEFNKLMERFQVKASHKIQWLIFIRKFLDPQHVSNGQTIPIKSQHKANAIQGQNQTTHLQHLISLLHNHIIFAYSTLRNAFLHLDKQKKGKISTVDLISIFKSFKYDVSEDQLKELMKLFDPYNKGSLNYQQFLEIFEEKETAEGHKWLTSTHKYNTSSKPTILAWKTVEDLMRQKMHMFWKDLVSGFKACDPHGTGFIYREQLRKLLDKVTIPLSDEHFDHLMQQLVSVEAEGKVNYLEFLSLLEIDVHPGDSDGVSTKVAQGNDDALLKRKNDHTRIMETIENNAAQRVSQMSLDEIIVRLRDQSSQQKPNIRQSFLQLDENRKGYISKKQFRKFLEGHGIHLTDDCFNDLIHELDFGEKGIDYSNFVRHLEDEDISKEMSNFFSQNHRYNTVRGDEFGLDAEVAEKKLRNKIRENFTTLREAFHKMDKENSGYISKSNFRQLLDYFMCFVNDNEFDKLCKSLRIDANTKMTYKQFLQRFQESDDIEVGHKWLVSNHRFNKLADSKPKTAAELHSFMAEKIHQNYKDISRAFCRIDYLGRGYITRREFRDLLDRLNVSLSSTEFRKLWNFYDPAKRNAITYQAFLKKIGVADAFTSGDISGTSTKILKNSADTLISHLESQENRHDNITYNQAVLSVSLDSEAAYSMLQKRIRDSETTVYIAFKNLDKQNKGYLVRDDFRNALNEMHLFLTEDDFNLLMTTRFNLGNDSDKITYDMFCRVFEDKHSGPDIQLEAVTSPERPSAKDIDQFKTLVSPHAGLLRVMFQAIDEEKTNCIHVSDFRRVVEEFCCTFPDSIFKEATNEFMNADMKVDYNKFLITLFETDKLELLHYKDLSTPGTTSSDSSAYTIANILERIKETVSARPALLQSAFAQADYSQSGVCSQTDFRNVIQNIIMRLTDDQYSRLLNHLPTDIYGNVDYSQFMQKYGRSLDSLSENSEALPSTPDSNNNNRLLGRPKTAPTLSVLDSSGHIERELKNVVSTFWRQLFSQFKLISQANMSQSMEHSFQITIYDLCRVLKQFSAFDFTPSKLAIILNRFGLRADGYFKYQDFLKAFAFESIGHTEEKGTVQRKLARANVPMTTAASDGQQFLNVAIRLRKRILEDWKDMRKAFKNEDHQNSGSLTVASFRRILRKFGILLSDEEFYQLISGFEAKTGNCVDYGAFLSSFLRSA